METLDNLQVYVVTVLSSVHLYGNAGIGFQFL